MKKSRYSETQIVKILKEDVQTQLMLNAAFRCCHVRPLNQGLLL